MCICDCYDTARPASLEVRKGSRGESVRGLDVHLEHPVQPPLVIVFEFMQCEYAGVVDQRVDGAEVGLGLVDPADGILRGLGVETALEHPLVVEIGYRFFQGVEPSRSQA